MTLQLFLLGWRVVEMLRVREGVKESGKVPGENVGDEPGDGLGMKDDYSGKARREQEAGQDEIDVELEAGIVQDDVDPSILLTAYPGRPEHPVRGEEVVDEHVLLRCL